LPSPDEECDKIAELESSTRLLPYVEPGAWFSSKGALTRELGEICHTRKTEPLYYMQVRGREVPYALSIDTDTEDKMNVKGWETDRLALCHEADSV
jgi:hypothetical protein